MIPLPKIAMDIVRHALPLVSLYVLGGGTITYLLLTAFDLSLGLLVIVGTTPDAKLDKLSQNQRSPLNPTVQSIVGVPITAIFLAIVAAIITLPISAAVIIFGLATGVNWGALFSSLSLWISVGAMALLAASRALAWRPDTSVPEQDVVRSRAANAAQITLIGTFTLLSYLLIEFGVVLVYALPVIYAAALVFYDLRPDVAQRIFPEQWQTRK
jgi:hypothetical protein